MSFNDDVLVDSYTNDSGEAEEKKKFNLDSLIALDLWHLA